MYVYTLTSIYAFAQYLYFSIIFHATCDTSLAQSVNHTLNPSSDVIAREKNLVEQYTVSYGITLIAPWHFVYREGRAKTSQ